MKKIILIVMLFVSSLAYSQSEVYSKRDTISAGTDTTYLYLNGVYENVTIVVADTTGTPTLTAKVNYAMDNVWHTAYVYTNYNTTAVSLALAPAEGTIYQFLDKSIRKLKLYITGGTLQFEVKARR